MSYIIERIGNVFTSVFGSDFIAFGFASPANVLLFIA